MQRVASELWNLVLEDIKEEVSDSQFRTWFSASKVRPAAFSDSRFRLEVANRYIKNVLQHNYRASIERSLGKQLGQTPELEFVISGELYHMLRKKQDEEYDGEPAGAREGVGVAPVPYRLHSRALNAAYTFDNFVVGSANKLAAVAARRVVETPGAVYSPLVFYGQHGLGKTHLLQASVAEAARRHRQFAVLFMPAETFTNEFMQAAAARALDAFRQRIRSHDFFALDDFQFLVGKKQTLQEFRHTLDALVVGGKQMLLAMTEHPGELEGVPPALTSRIMGGLLVQLEPPDAELRCELVRRKAQRWHCELTQEVVEYIASHVSGNVREMEGAVAKVVALAAADGQSPDLAIARRALREYNALSQGPVSLDAVATAVARRFEIDAGALAGRGRVRSVAVPRQVAMYVAKQLSGYSLGEIGRYFGGRNHSTVLYAVNRIAAELSENRELRRIIALVKTDLGR